MITKVDSSQSIGKVGVAQLDITPPIGIYHRMWGAAKHDQATGVHRPLMLTLLWMAHSDEPSEKFVSFVPFVVKNPKHHERRPSL